jgi:hypothetical protein
MKLGASGGKNNEGIGALGKTQPGYYGASTVRHEWKNSTGKILFVRMKPERGRRKISAAKQTEQHTRSASKAN